MGAEDLVGEPDWSVFDDLLRLSFVESIDERAAERSPSLDRFTRLAATLAGAEFAQISLLGSSQFVPSAHGTTYEAGDQHTPARDSLCGVTVAHDGTLAIGDTRGHGWVRELPPVASGAVGSYLGVPLRDPDGRPIGALCTYDRRSRSWDAGMRSSLEDLAALVSRELEILTSLSSSTTNEVRLRNVVAQIVERPRLSRATHLVARARYLMPIGAPAGGDWIDITQVDADRAAFSVGDVAGHGLEAVVVMDELRHALRAYAFDSLDPGDALVRADRLLCAVRPDQIATALVGDYSAATQLLRLASAGHPPPVLVHDGTATLLSVTPRPPLGVLSAAGAITSLAFSPGDRLVVVTDGVFERRGESVDVGLTWVVAAIESIGPDIAPDATADALLATLLDGEPADDACILIIDNVGPGEAIVVDSVDQRSARA